jgi:mannose-6-phosphate isomerase-like protein (cupin superfamily)
MSHSDTPGAAPASNTRVAPVTVIRFAEMVPNWGDYHESLGEGNHRAIYRYVGDVPGQARRAALPGWDFCNGITMAPPGNGAPLHDHRDEEVFMVWEGEFEIFWEDHKTKETKKVILGLYDAIRIPPGIMRGFRNVGKDNGFLYFIHGQGSYEYPVYHESNREGLAEGVRTEPHVGAPNIDPASQVVRYEECELNFQVYHETDLPEGVRGIRRYVGAVGGERKGVGPPPSLEDGEVAFVINENRPASGAPLHDHPFEEMFIALESRWTVFWLDAQGGRHEAVLDPWDACWVPPGVQRGFRNAGRGWGKLHVLQGQPDAPPPEYHRDYSDLGK